MLPRKFSGNPFWKHGAKPDVSGKLMQTDRIEVTRQESFVPAIARDVVSRFELTQHVARERGALPCLSGQLGARNSISFAGGKGQAE